MTRAASCAATRGERIVRGIAALFVAAVAVSMLDTPLVAIPAGICAALLAVAAVTGWCPGAPLAPRGPSEPAENTLGFADARRAAQAD
jgi:hypothetical protein